MPQIAGGCLCGQVRYSANSEPAFVGICHCKDCQKFTGGPFAAIFGLPKSAVSFQGKLAAYRKPGDTGKPITRSFCPECGSSIADEAAALPDMVMIGVGTLDDASWVKPSTEIFCDSAQPWVSLQGGLKRFARMPG